MLFRSEGLSLELVSRVPLKRSGAGVHATFRLREGEILGLAGLVGAGRP